MFAESLAPARRSDDRTGMAYGVLGMACLAGDLGDGKRAALLHGAADALFDSTGQTRQEPEATYRLASLERVRALVGLGEREGLRDRGRHLGPEDAVREALAVRT